MPPITIDIGGFGVRLYARRGRDAKSWWVADFRPAFRQHSLGIEATKGSEARAHIAAGALLEKFRGKRQGELSFPDTHAPGTLKPVLEACLAGTVFKKTGTQRWATEHTDRLIAELGHVALRDFEPPAGHARVRAWTDAMRGTLSPHTILHRHTTLRRALAWAKTHEWIVEVPVFPRPNLPGQPLYVSTCRPVSQAHYEKARDALFPAWRAWPQKAGWIARRLLYLDFVRYTGAHKHDADTLQWGAHISLDFGTFLRRNLKNEHKVEAMWIRMPPPLLDALRTERERLGDEWDPDALVCGHWGHPARELGDACKRLGIPTFDLLDLRCTVATELAAAGVPEHVVVALLGHTSSKMVREVYRKIPREQLSEGMDKIGRKPTLPARAAGAPRALSAWKGDADQS